MVTFFVLKIGKITVRKTKRFEKPKCNILDLCFFAFICILREMKQEKKRKVESCIFFMIEAFESCQMFCEVAYFCLLLVGVLSAY